MNRYSKGARSERELLNMLASRGYSVIRSAGSGVNAISPDIIAAKAGKMIAIECKAWNRGSLSLPIDQFQKLVEWQNNTAFPTFVAWRMNGKGWFFIKLEEFEKGTNAYNITRSKTFAIGRRLESIL